MSAARAALSLCMVALQDAIICWLIRHCALFQRCCVAADDDSWAVLLGAGRIQLLAAAAGAASSCRSVPTSGCPPTPVAVLEWLHFATWMAWLMLWVATGAAQHTSALGSLG